MTERTVLEEFQMARRPELASKLLAIIVPLCYHAAKSGQGPEAIAAIYDQWYLQKKPIDCPEIHEYSDYGFTICIKCETVHSEFHTAILRHCCECKSYSLWNPLWFLDYIAEKAEVHPSFLETLLTRYIHYARANNRD